MVKVIDEADAGNASQAGTTTPTASKMRMMRLVFVAIRWAPFTIPRDHLCSGGRGKSIAHSMISRGLGSSKFRRSRPPGTRRTGLSRTYLSRNPSLFFHDSRDSSSAHSLTFVLQEHSHP